LIRAGRPAGFSDFIAPGCNRAVQACVSTGVNRPAPDSVTGSRALEWAIVAIAAMLAAGAVRSELGLLWQALSLLINI
jgi:hypothetical protein